ncbi:MAG: hypothetical protein ACFNUI_05820 [Negativicutes bacterium]
MGKAARRMKKKEEQAKAAGVRQENARWEEKLKKQMAAGQYAEAIETLAELVKGNDIKPEFMYDAAYAYFMVGDYERAGQWINNTLTYEPGNIPVRILLARLLILQEREDDGLAIFDFVLDKGLASLTEEQKDEIEEIVEFYGRSEREKVQRNYPHIAAFLKLEAAAPGTRDVGSILASLKAKVAAAGEAAGNAVEEATAAVKPALAAGAAKAGEAAAAIKPELEARAEAAAKKPAEILASLKKRIAEVSGEKKAAEPSAAAPAEKFAVSPAASSATSATTAAAVAKAPAPPSVAAAELVKENIRRKNLPAADQAELLNSFAGGYYYQGDLTAAEVLLTAAIELGEPADGTLRNMALVQMEMGKREEALRTASRMKLADFPLLRLLRA